MIVDTSALMAVLLKEPNHLAFMNAMARAPQCDVSAGSWIEISAVITRGQMPAMEADLNTLIANFAIGTSAVTVEQARIGYDAYRKYGRGSRHPASLNFGDCFSYALAKATGRPLLFTGDDFTRTDIAAALP